MSAGGRRFHLIERLGEGAFGEVYLAEMDSDAGFRRRVAVKLLGADAPGRAEAGRRMRDEARILGRLHHKHIVTVLDLLQLGGQWAVVMDYIPGPDLEHVLMALAAADERVPPPAALEICAAIADAIDAAFSTDDGSGPLRVLHRDIKPGNVILTPDAEIKVLDFGVARVNLASRESRTGARVGTERYMSPQRLIGDDDDLAGDVYALGVTAIELLLREEVDKGSIDPTRHAEWSSGWMNRLRALGPAEPLEDLIGLLEAAVAWDAAQRPSPRRLADELPELAHRFDGENLTAFARHFVPRVAGLLGTQRQPIDWLLTESALPTEIIGPTTTPARSEGPRAPVPPRRRAALALPAVLLGSAALIALAVALAPRAAPKPDDPPPIVRTEPAPPPIDPRGPDASFLGVGPRLHVDGSRKLDPVTVAAVEEAPATADKPPVRVGARTSRSPAPPQLVPPAPIVSRALVVIPDAAAIRVSCGGVSGEGTTSARVTGFPAGRCRISADYQGETLGADVVVDGPREIHCRILDSVLTCS